MSAPPANPRQRRLEREARDLLAQASVVAETSAADIQSEPVKTGKPGGKAPKGEGFGLFDEMAGRFRGCRSVRDWEGAVEWAREELDATRRRRVVQIIPFKVRILVEWEGHGDLEVERAMQVPRSNVRRWRLEDGRDPLTGKKKEKKDAA